MRASEGRVEVSGLPANLLLMPEPEPLPVPALNQGGQS